MKKELIGKVCYYFLIFILSVLSASFTLYMFYGVELNFFLIGLITALLSGCIVLFIKNKKIKKTLINVFICQFFIGIATIHYFVYSVTGMLPEFSVNVEKNIDEFKPFLDKHFHEAGWLIIEKETEDCYLVSYQHSIMPDYDLKRFSLLKEDITIDMSNKDNNKIYSNELNLIKYN